MLGLNVPLDIAPVPHGLVADPAIVRSILRCQEELIEILWFCDLA